MSKIVEFGRDLPCLKPKRRPKNLFQLALSKNWIGQYLVRALDAGRAPVLEKTFSDKQQFKIWCSNHFRERLLPSDIEVADNGETADFPIPARLEALKRYGVTPVDRLEV